MLCNVTGTLYLPNGQLGKSLTLRFRRADQRVTAEYLGAVVPHDVYTQSDKSGQVDFEILTGVYVMHVEGGYSVRAIVPDAATADIADCIDAAAVPDQPPVWYQQALDARDEAQEAATDAEQAVQDAAGYASEAEDWADEAAQSAVVGQEALDLAEAHDPYIDATKPSFITSGATPIPANWSRKDWTNQEVYDPRLGDALPDLPEGTYPIGVDAEGYTSITMPNGGQVTSKSVIKRNPQNDIIVTARMVATGVGTGSTGYVGVFYSQEGASTALRSRSSQPLVEGVNYVTYFIPKSTIFQASVIRPFARRAGTTGTVTLQNIQVIEVVNGIIPFLAFNPPVDGTTDSSDAFSQMVSATASISNSVKIVDGGGLTYSVASPIENNVTGTIWRNFTIRAIGNRDDWSGGSTDSKGQPTQKGVIRRRADNQWYENVKLHCGEYEPIEVVTSNSVYTEYRTLANGFEDAPVGSGNKSKVCQYRLCLVEQFDDYGYRYASETGGGFDLIESRATKQAGSPFRDADMDRGAGLILDSNDGFVVKGTFFGGEHQIWQKSGGTIQLHENHPWRGVAAYQRRYFGPVGVPIETGIQIRTPGQIGDYDSARVQVERRESDWQVIVTPLENIDQANAAEVRIRRDETCAFMEGWGSQWTGTYIDGGTIRLATGGHKFIGGYGLVGALTYTDAEFTTPTLLSAFEFRPGSNAAVPPEEVQWVSSSFGKRMIMYPRTGQTSFSTNNLRFGVKALEDCFGRYSADTLNTYSRDTGGVIEAFRSSQSVAGIKIIPNAVADADAPIIFTGSGSPEGVLSAPVGSQYLRTNGSLGTVLYVKSSGSGNTGWTTSFSIGSDGIAYHQKQSGSGAAGSKVAEFRSPNGNATSHISLAHGNATLENMVNIYSGNYSPVDILVAGQGSIFLRRNGGAGLTLYVKEAGNDASGWVAK